LEDATLSNFYFKTKQNQWILRYLSPAIVYSSCHLISSSAGFFITIYRGLKNLWVSDCCFNVKWTIFQLYHDEKTRYIFVRWWRPLGTISTHLVGF
jgi:hypothetical protein